MVSCRQNRCWRQLLENNRGGLTELQRHIILRDAPVGHSRSSSGSDTFLLFHSVFSVQKELTIFSTMSSSLRHRSCSSAAPGAGWVEEEDEEEDGEEKDDEEASGTSSDSL